MKRNLIIPAWVLVLVLVVGALADDVNTERDAFIAVMENAEGFKRAREIADNLQYWAWVDAQPKEVQLLADSNNPKSAVRAMQLYLLEAEAKSKPNQSSNPFSEMFPDLAREAAARKSQSAPTPFSDMFPDLANEANKRESPDANFNPKRSSFTPRPERPTLTGHIPSQAQPYRKDAKERAVVYEVEEPVVHHSNYQAVSQVLQDEAIATSVSTRPSDISAEAHENPALYVDANRFQGIAIHIDALSRVDPIAASHMAQSLGGEAHSAGMHNTGHNLQNVGHNLLVDPNYSPTHDVMTVPHTIHMDALP